MYYKQYIKSILLGVTLTTLYVATCYADEEKVLNVYNWVDYIAPDTVANFEKETGIKVHYDTYEVNETLDAKLSAKKSGYDIVVPSSDWAKLQIDNGLLQKLDKNKLTNFKNLDPNILDRMKQSDPDNAYLAGYLWGYTAIGLNVDKVVKALGKTPVPANTWELVFNPVYTKKLKSCGIMYLDSPTDIMPLALHYLGKQAFSNNAADYVAATDMLKKVRPDIKFFASSGQAEKLIDQSACIAIGWGADFYRARSAAKEKKNGLNIAPVVPKTGALLFMDSMAIPKDAKHPNNAHLFINYILRPEVHASITNFTKYANPNMASKKFIERNIENDKALFPEKSDFDRLISPKALDEKTIAIRAESFEKFKEGK
jgi:putrescine transport system substrate-binding protein